MSFSLYRIVLKDKIDFQNLNIKVTLPYFSESVVGGADFDRSDFFLPNTKISFYIFKITFKLLKSNLKQALSIIN